MDTAVRTACRIRRGERRVHVQRNLTSAPGVPVALTIGNFDGVHRGHQAMLSRLVEAAEDLALAAGRADVRAASARVLRARRRAAAAVDAAREARAVSRVRRRDRPTSRASMRAWHRSTAGEFVDDVLVRGLNAHWVLVGDDFRFGARRAGDLALLRATTRTVQRRSDAHGRRRRRARVEHGGARGARGAAISTRAAALLGRTYAISGRVVHGDKLGRKLGFPDRERARCASAPPLTGIFAVACTALAPRRARGVASLGVRPTVKPTASRCSRSSCSTSTRRSTAGGSRVEFLHKLRDEEKFADARRADATRSRTTSRRRATISPREADDAPSDRRTLLDRTPMPDDSRTDYKTR